MEGWHAHARVNVSLSKEKLRSVTPSKDSLEKDARFLYCACAVSYILNDWSGLDVEKSVQYARSLQVNPFASLSQIFILEANLQLLVI